MFDSSETMGQNSWFDVGDFLLYTIIFLRVVSPANIDSYVVGTPTPGPAFFTFSLIFGTTEDLL